MSIILSQMAIGAGEWLIRVNCLGSGGAKLISAAISTAA